MPVKTISPADVARHFGDPGLNLIDVRTAAEYRQVHAAQARSIPLDDLDPATISGTPDRPVFLICKSGGRSAKAANHLESAGISDICVMGSLLFKMPWNR